MPHSADGGVRGSMAVARELAFYEAKRAASLAGVPERTLYHWAKVGIWVPTSDVKGYMRWSYSDLFVLRLIDWLRGKASRPDDGFDIPKAPMRQIRSLLASLPDVGERLIESGVHVWVIGGRVRVRVAGEELAFEPRGPQGFGQTIAGDESRNLVAPFDVHPGIRGPHLVVPRETLRILPGVVSGEPHVDGARLPTQVIRTLDRNGYLASDIRALYPSLNDASINDALDLEIELEGNLRRVA
jgi:uncharacterized protein (DUF433 family)